MDSTIADLMEYSNKADIMAFIAPLPNPPPNGRELQAGVGSLNYLIYEYLIEVFVPNLPFWGRGG